LKKVFFVGILSFCIFFGKASAYAETSSQIALDNPERLKSIVIGFLMPEIDMAVSKFYKPYLRIKPTVATYQCVEITRIEGEGPRCIVTIEIEPYVGPHEPVGKERMTFIIGHWGEVIIKQYEHLKSYDLPPHLQDLWL